MSKKLTLFLDSGAPTLYNKYVRAVNADGVMGSHLKNRKYDNFDFVNSDEFKTYRKNHIQFLKKNKQHLEVYTVLDIINNPELTWEQQQYYESHGLKPLPVWHFGSDIKWLHHYIDKGYGYIGIGGMVPNPKKVLLPILDKIWANVLTDNKGLPIVKIHGFAATSVPLMKRYPWYSVDSTTWIKVGIFGSILLPKHTPKGIDFLVAPTSLSVSSKSGDIKKANKHINNLSPTVKRTILQYIKERGFTLGRSAFDKKGNEVIIEPGLSNQSWLRLKFNAEHFLSIQNALPKYPWKYKPRNVKKGLLNLL